MNELNLDDLENITGGMSIETYQYQKKLDYLVMMYNNANFDGMDDSTKIAKYQFLLKTLDFIKKEAFKEHHVVLEPTVPIKDIFG